MEDGSRASKATCISKFLMIVIMQFDRLTLPLRFLFYMLIIYVIGWRI